MRGFTIDQPNQDEDDKHLGQMDENIDWNDPCLWPRQKYFQEQEARRICLPKQLHLCITPVWAQKLPKGLHDLLVCLGESKGSLLS
jgi:hypothetical protein